MLGWRIPVGTTATGHKTLVLTGTMLSKLSCPIFDPLFQTLNAWKTVPDVLQCRLVSPLVMQPIDRTCVTAPTLMGCIGTHPNSPCMPFSLWCAGCLFIQTVLLPLLRPSKTSHYLGDSRTSKAQRYFVHREAGDFLHLVYQEGLSHNL